MAKKSKKKRDRKKVRTSGPRSAKGLEWVGGRFTMPAYVMEKGPYRPEVIVWLEVPTLLIVGMEVIDPKEASENAGSVLTRAMSTPLAGSTRRPARVRVQDSRLADEVKSVLPEMEVVVAPAPELEDLKDHLMEFMGPREEPDLSYFEQGRIPAEAVEAMFSAAKIFYELAPWKLAQDTQVLRVDIPNLGVVGACVSIIGAQGESLGMIIFPSVGAFDRFLQAAESFEAVDSTIDLGTRTLSLNYERGADLPRTMRREVATHKWPVANADAYPWVQYRDRDGIMIPLTEREIRIVTACAASLSAFFAKHADIFRKESFEPICESYFDENDLEVRITAPYEAWTLFEVNEPPGE